MAGESLGDAVVAITGDMAPLIRTLGQARSRVQAFTAKDVGAGFGTAAKGVGQGLGASIKAAGAALAGVTGALGPAAAQATRGFGSGLGAAAKGLGAGLASSAKAIGPAFGSATKGLGAGIGQASKGFGAGIGQALKGTAAPIRELSKGLNGLAKTFGTTLTQSIKAAQPRPAARGGGGGGGGLGFGLAAGLGQSLTSAGLNLIADAARAARDALVGAVTRAADLGESMDKVDAVFGAAGAPVKAFADQMAADFGSSRQAILDAAGGFGLITNGAGMATAESARLAVEFAKLADDASSLFNVPLPEALDKIKSGLVGESEPMRAFGVLLDEAAVKAEAARMGLGAMGSELTAQQKVQARASLIKQGLAPVVGNRAATIGSAKNQMVMAAGRGMNLLTDLGGTLMPAFQELVGGVNRVLGGIGAAFQANRGAIAGWVAVVVGRLRAFGAGLAAALAAARRFAATPVIQAALQALGAAFGWVQGVVTAAWGAVGAAFEAGRGAITAALAEINGIYENWGAVVASVGASAGAALRAVVETFTWMGQAVGLDVGPAVQGAIQGLGGAFAWLRDTVAAAVAVVTVMWENFGSVAEIVGITAVGYVRNIGEILGWLGATAQAFLGWLGANWTSVFIDAFNATVGAASNFYANIRDLIAAVMRVLADPLHAKFDFEPTPLLQGFQATMGKLPEIAGPALSSVDDQIAAVTEKMAERTARRGQEEAARKGAALAAGDVEGAVAPNVAPNARAAAGEAPGKKKEADIFGSADLGDRIARAALGGGVPEKQLAEAEKQTKLLEEIKAATPVAPAGGKLVPVFGK